MVPIGETLRKTVKLFILIEDYRSQSKRLLLYYLL